MVAGARPIPRAHDSWSARRRRGRSPRSELEGIIDGDEPVSDQTVVRKVQRGSPPTRSGEPAARPAEPEDPAPPPSPHHRHAWCARSHRGASSRSIPPPLEPDPHSVGWPWVLRTLQTALAPQAAGRAWKPEHDTGDGRRLRLVWRCSPTVACAGSWRSLCRRQETRICRLGVAACE